MVRAGWEQAPVATQHHSFIFHEGRSMTPDEKAERQAANRAAAADRRRKDARKRELELRRRIKTVWDKIRDEEQRSLTYIAKQIDLGTREDEDLKLLRNRRHDIIRQYLPKGDSQ